MTKEKEKEIIENNLGKLGEALEFANYNLFYFDSLGEFSKRNKLQKIEKVILDLQKLIDEWFMEE